jgi:flagellar biosynthetic protein FliO
LINPNAFVACVAFGLPETQGGFGGSEGPDLTRYLTVCAVLLVSIGGTAILFRRLILRTMKQRASGRSLQVLDVLPLGNKQRLCVVRCYDRTFALGLADHAVNLISELDPVIGEDAITATPSNADLKAFEDTLRQAPIVPPAPRRGARPELAKEGLLA